MGVAAIAAVGLIWLYVGDSEEDKELRFAGVIENAVFGCTFDADCYMTISGTTVLFGAGWSKGPWGEVFQLVPVEKYIEKKVLVYCRKDEKESERWCSLQGNSAYYIKLDD